MWRNSRAADGEVRSVTGLFPAPVQGECPEHTRRLFNVLGRLVARYALVCDGDHLSCMVVYVRLLANMTTDDMVFVPQLT
jgi:hypothetical protein